MSTPRLDQTFATALREHLVSEVEHRNARHAFGHHRPVLLAVVAAVVAVVLGMAVLSGSTWFGGDEQNPADVGAPDGDSASDLGELLAPNCQNPRSAREVGACVDRSDPRGIDDPSGLDPVTQEWLEAVRNNEPGQLSILVEGREAIDPAVVEECRQSLVTRERGPLHPLYCNALVLMADGDIPIGHHYMEDELRELAGPTVVVAEPSAASFKALIHGRLEAVGGCLGVQGSVVVWPSGTKVVDLRPLSIEVPRYGTLVVGDIVELGGGFVLEHSSDDVAPGSFGVGGTTVPAACAEHDVWLAG